MHHQIFIISCFNVPALSAARRYILPLVSLPSPLQVAARGAEIADAPDCVIPNPLLTPKPLNHVIYQLDRHVIPAGTALYRNV